MPDITETYRNAIADYLRGDGAPVAIAGLFLDLFNGDPQGAGESVLEDITGSATRPEITSEMGEASSGTSTNAGEIEVAEAAEAGATITHIAVYNAATSGSLVMSDALSSGSQVITEGNPVVIPASGISIAIS